MPNSSLSPEAIEILKLAHGQMNLKFKNEAEALTFYRKVQQLPLLRNCFDMPKYMWADDRGHWPNEAYWYINITSYGRGATDLLKTLGMI